ncbi:MAG: hypothetical protein IKU44_00590 [Firmicutes bacterium]|nr:hypothetical protein [Bacillota bacterium]
MILIKKLRRNRKIPSFFYCDTHRK